jgi:hypothetical protein
MEAPANAPLVTHAAPVVQPAATLRTAMLAAEHAASELRAEWHATHDACDYLPDGPERDGLLVRVADLDALVRAATAAAREAGDRYRASLPVEVVARCSCPACGFGAYGHD